MIDLLSSLPGAVAQGLIWGIMAVGVYITYKLLDIADLTVDGSICTGAAVCTMMLLSGRSLWLAVLCAVAAGLLAGVVTGLLHIWLGIPPILAGILTQMTLWSVNLKILGKANQGLSVRDNHVLLSQMDVPGALVVLAIAAVLVVAVLYLFFGTELGCGIRATGCNPVMSRAQGINTDLSKVIGLSLSNGLVALSGALLCQYQGYADINMGRGAVVIGLAAVVIGEAVVKHISPNFAVRLTGVLVGAVIYYLSQMDVPGALVVLAIAAVLVVAVLYLFFGTELGCGIRATGCNPVMSRAQGINTDLSKVIGLSLSNGLVALSGALLCQYQGYADINMGRGAVVIGLAAVVIGEAVVKHISPNFAVRLTGVLVGAVIYYLVYQVIIFVGFDTDLLKMFSALVVAAFLGVPYVKKQLARKHHVKGGIRHA